MRRHWRTKPIRRCRNTRRSTGRSREKCEIAFGRGIPARLRCTVLGLDDLFCRMCGVIPGDIDDLTGQRAKFHVGKIKANKLGGRDELSNLRVLCSTCNRGAKALFKERTYGAHFGLAGQDTLRPALSALVKEIGEAR